MEKLKKFVSLVAAAALLAVLPNVSTLQVSAAQPTTYYVKYDTDKNDWRMQIGSWDNGYEGRSPYYLNEGDEKVKDGDIVVVLDSDDEAALSSATLTVNAHLSNLTVNRAGIVIYTGGVDECYVLGDSYAAINGNVTNAYVYDNAVCTFNNNVTNLRLISSSDNRVRCTVSVGGTVSYASTANPGGLINEYYNFTAGSFYHDKASGLMTDTSKYSTTGSAPATSTQSETTTQTTAEVSAASTSSSEYDDVPKTGESNLIIWLFGISAVCLAGRYALRKTMI
jgi:hypothetical protein